MAKIYIMRMEPYSDIWVLRERAPDAILKALFTSGYLSLDDVLVYKNRRLDADMLEIELELSFEETFLF